MGLGDVRVIQPGTSFDAEGLLAAIDAQGLRPARALVVRGDGGRDTLIDGLRARGAQVEVVTAYRRAAPRPDPARLEQLRHWIERPAPCAIVATSSEGVRNLAAALGEAGLGDWFRSAAWVATHAQIARAAREAGVVRVIQSEPGNDGIVDAIARLQG